MKKMDLKQLLSNVEEEEELVNFIVTIPKSQKENLQKLAANLLPKMKRGRISHLTRVIFQEVIEQNKNKL